MRVALSSIPVHLSFKPCVFSQPPPAMIFCLLITCLINQLQLSLEYPFQAANVGDSAAVLWHTSDPPHKCEQLTTDHRISAPAERHRLRSIGIELTEGSDRLYGLNVARCLGDHYLKEFGFSATPSVSHVHKLPPDQSALLILASDGLWDVAAPSKVMEVRRFSPHPTQRMQEAS